MHLKVLLHCITPLNTRQLQWRAGRGEPILAIEIMQMNEDQ